LIAAGVVIGAGCVTLGQQARAVVGAQALAAPADTYKNLSLFGDVYDKVRSEYVEKPNEQKMVEAAINGMLTSLDPHSSYLDEKGFKDMRTQTEGKFGGLGSGNGSAGEPGADQRPDQNFANHSPTFDLRAASQGNGLIGWP